MNVVILLSGSSSRFYKEGYKIPKFLIKINNRTVLNYIISNFDVKNDNFIFICRRDFFLKKKYGIKKIIEDSCKKFKIYLIDEHKKGPVYSLINFSNELGKLKNLIVNYCDFFWIWEYSDFKLWLKKNTAETAAVCYKGFHPHYINSLKFAYVKTKNNSIIRVKEKESFTNDREKEPAMSGTFYFKSGKKLIEACNKIIKNRDKVKNEYYVSLLFNYIKSKKQFIYLIKYFFQWGTPTDLQQYLNWSKNLNINEKVDIRNYQNILMMAGKGKRLKQIQNVKKPFIKLENNSLMYENLNSNILSNQKKALINGDKIDYKKLNLKKYQPIEVGKTQSQLHTIRKFFEKNTSLNNHFFFSPCDCKIYFKSKGLTKITKQINKFDVFVFTYKNYDYAIKNPSQFGWIQKKNKIEINKFYHKPKRYKKNNEIITGFFLLNKNINYIDLIDNYFQKNNNIKSEHSFDNFVEFMNKKKYKVYYYSVNNFLCIGTKKEYLIYEYWKQAHKKIKN